MDLCGHKALIAQLEKENAFLRQEVTGLKAEYKSLLERTLAQYKVPESPREIREFIKHEEVEAANLFEEESIQDDTREPADTLAG